MFKSLMVLKLVAVICLWQTACSAAEKPGLHPDGMTRAEVEKIISSEKNGAIEVFAMIQKRASERNIKFKELLCDEGVGPEALAPYADLVNVMLSRGSFPLGCIRYLPKSEKTYAKVQWLCDHGADVEYQSIAQLCYPAECVLFSPLYDAVKRGGFETARILLAAGATINKEVLKLIDNREVSPEICKMVADEVAGRRRWQDGEGLRGAWAKASVSVATGAAVPVGPLQTMSPGSVTAEDLK